MSPVVINEFELVPAPTAENETPGATETTATEAAATPAAQSPVQETERLMRRHAERLLRLWAH